MIAGEALVRSSGKFWLEVDNNFANLPFLRIRVKGTVEEEDGGKTSGFLSSLAAAVSGP